MCKPYQNLKTCKRDVCTVKTFNLGLPGRILGNDNQIQNVQTGVFNSGYKGMA